ncbi:MAG: 4Fe-4S dicluster domain-containing protein [Negativicutes bacterium]|nr:4Fe-4S dicluster domain-containing protein [Negativicutes bacterium]
MAGTIGIDLERCLNSMYKKAACQRCRRQCPSGSIDATLAVDRKDCNECGMCLAICPSEAIWGEQYSRQALDDLFVDDSSPLVLACRRQSAESPWPCLGFLDPRLLLSLVASGGDGGRKVVLDDQSCSGCKEGVAEYLRQLADDVNQLLSQAEKPLVESGEAARRVARREKTVSRRDFFTQLLGATVTTVREVMATNIDGGQPLPRQALFTKYAGALSMPAAVTTKLFHNICINEKCQACGFCARICPVKAISIQDHGAALDFYHLPQKCTGCGVCVAHCPVMALSLTTAEQMAVYHVGRTELPRCTKCGELYQPSGNQPVCLECLLKHDYRGFN